MWAHSNLGEYGRTHEHVGFLHYECRRINRGPEEQRRTILYFGDEKLPNFLRPFAKLELL